MLQLLMIFLPAGMRRFIAQRALGWDIHPKAYIGRSLILATHVSMGPESGIGSFNVIRHLDELRLAKGALIGTRNWIEGHRYAERMIGSDDRRCALVLGEWAKITTGHQIDCSDRVELGAHAALAGYRSQILTHSLDLVRDLHVSSAVEIGERAAVMSGCLLLNGTRVPARSIVSAGSVVTTKLTKEQTFYRGNPAQAVRALPDLAFFRRGDEEERRWL